MPGTDDDERAAALVRHLTVTGWLLLGGSFGFIAFQLDRVRSIGGGDSQFEVWDQRVEVLSFIMLPPNLSVLVSATAAAVAAAWIAGPGRGPWLATLLRIVIGLAIAMVAIGAVSIVNIYANDTGSVDGVFLRLGGMSMAAGLTWISIAAHRS